MSKGLDRNYVVIVSILTLTSALIYNAGNELMALVSASFHYSFTYNILLHPVMINMADIRHE